MDSSSPDPRQGCFSPSSEQRLHSHRRLPQELRNLFREAVLEDTEGDAEEVEREQIIDEAVAPRPPKQQGGGPFQGATLDVEVAEVGLDAVAAAFRPAGLVGLFRGEDVLLDPVVGI